MTNFVERIKHKKEVTHSLLNFIGKRGVCVFCCQEQGGKTLQHSAFQSNQWCFDEASVLNYCLSICKQIPAAKITRLGQQIAEYEKKIKIRKNICNLFQVFGPFYLSCRSDSFRNNILHSNTANQQSYKVTLHIVLCVQNDF